MPSFESLAGKARPMESWGKHYLESGCRRNNKPKHKEYLTGHASKTLDPAGTEVPMQEARHGGQQDRTNTN